ARGARVRRLVLLVPARVELPGRHSARRRRRAPRPRRLGDPRPGRLVSRRSAVGRGGDPVRRPRRGAAARGPAALRSGRSLPPAGRALAERHAATTLSGVTVVGAGVFGASTARELALRGWDVTLVEQYTPGTVRSGSGGDTRLLRMAHGAVDWYTRSAWRARELWLDLERESQTHLFEPVGVA